MQPQYIQIAEQLRHQIVSGEYPIGKKIPTENKLAQSLGVSRSTVRHALDLLTAEERLVRVKGSGTFVAQPKLVHESTSFVTSYREESRKKESYPTHTSNLSSNRKSWRSNWYRLKNKFVRYCNALDKNTIPGKYV